MNELARLRDRESLCPHRDRVMLSADQRISNNGSFCNDRMLRVIAAGDRHCKKTSEVWCDTELRKSATAITADNRGEFRSSNSQLTHPNFSRRRMRCQLANWPLHLIGNSHKQLSFMSLQACTPKTIPCSQFGGGRADQPELPLWQAPVCVPPNPALDILKPGPSGSGPSVRCGGSAGCRDRGPWPEGHGSKRRTPDTYFGSVIKEGIPHFRSAAQGNAIVEPIDRAQQPRMRTTPRRRAGCPFWNCRAVH